MTTGSRHDGYLGDVCFDGWDYLAPPPARLDAAAGEDPWLLLCRVLERAKRGDLTGAERLPELCRSEDPTLRGDAQYLLACIGRQEQLEALDDDILAEGGAYRMEAADCAAISGSLRFVDRFIAGYRLAFGETTRMAIEDGLSNLLTTDPESWLAVDCLLAEDRAAGEARLRALAEQQAAAYGPRVSFYRGAPLALERIVADVEEQLDDDEPLASLASVQALVTRLQTMIGFSQHGMFDEERQRWDEGLIRAELSRARTRAPRCTPGLRYFFGHPAPL